MKTPALIAAVLAATVLSTPAFAADGALPGAEAHQLGAKLAGASLLAAQVEHVTGRHVGGAVPDAVTQRLAVITRQLEDARALAGGAMDREIDNVLAAAARVTDGRTLSDGALLAAREIAIKTQALQINADLVQANAHLAKAAEGDGGSVASNLAQARADLEAALDRGGYHVQNDIEEIGLALGELAGQGTVDSGFIAERITEITDHMYCFGVNG